MQTKYILFLLQDKKGKLVVLKKTENKINKKRCVLYNYTCRRSEEKPAIVLAALELSHPLMSGPLPPCGGSKELLLKQRGLG